CGHACRSIRASPVRNRAWSSTNRKQGWVMLMAHVTSLAVSPLRTKKKGPLPWERPRSPLKGDEPIRRSAGAARLHGIRQDAQHFLGVIPADACVRDALAIGQLRRIILAGGE